MKKTKTHEETELEILVKNAPANDRPIVEEFIPQILALCRKFSKSGQSGHSAPYTASVICQTLEKLLMQEPLSPIMGSEDEWTDKYRFHDADETRLNLRCSSILKDVNTGIAYYLDAIVFQERCTITNDELEEGEEPDPALPFSYWSNHGGTVDGVKSTRIIEFPFTPKTFFVEVVKEFLPDEHDEEPFFEGNDGKKFRYHIKDRSQLDEALKHYPHAYQN